MLYWPVLFITSIFNERVRRVRQYKVGIYDTDRKYISKLMDYINNDIANPLLVIGFSTKEKLEEYLDEHQLDLLIMPEDASMTPNEQCKEILYMQTGKGTLYRAGNCMYKFSKADDILKQILQKLKVEGVDIKKHLYQTYGVISPIGRSGKTRLSKALCAYDEVRGGLYIGMEEYGSLFDEDMGEQNVMSNLLFLAKNQSPEFLPYLEEKLRQVDDIYVISSPASYLDLRSMTKADVCWMLEELVKWGRFTTIVCDIGGAALDELTILEAFDHLLMPVLEDKHSLIKVDRFMKLLERRELGKLAGRIRRLKLPDVEYNEPAMIGYLERKLERD